MPSKLKEPYLSRKRAVGYALYELYESKEMTTLQEKADVYVTSNFGAASWAFFRMDRELLYG